MELTPMQYKDYVWPHNPRTYQIRYERKLALHKVPFGRYVIQDMGMSRRVMTGEGEFYGPGAYEEFKKLASVFYGEGPGSLIHPVWQTAKAYFAELSLAQEPRRDYVRYTFTFWEDFAGYEKKLVRKQAKGGSEGTGKVHRVVRGETMYSIANAYGLTLEDLVGRNPQIKNPSLIHPGEQVKVG